MVILILGLILFLGTHSVKIFADSWRTSQIEKMGLGKWRGLYSLISLIGFILIIIGYGQARLSTIFIWMPPHWTWHLTATLNLIAFILLISAYVPKNAIKEKVRDPMILGIKTWAFAHLLSNGSLAGIILFGSFLLWAIVDYKSCRVRITNTSKAKTQTTPVMTSATLVISVFCWAAFAKYAHQILIGVNPVI